MPFTFIEIEEQKTRRIWIFFVVLVVLYFALLATLLAAASEALSLPYGTFLNTRVLLGLSFVSLTAATLHFCFSTMDIIRFLHDNLAAVKPDPEDGIHRQLLNILQEIQVVTGNRKKIDCVVIPTLAMNALAAVDLRGNATIAITEGLLSRLTRPQLEAVVAHEAYHILSGDCLEATVAASLFGFPASALEKLSGTFAPEFRLSPAFLLARLLLKLSQLLNMFISREREYRADAGAVRMTRNPLALAEGLQRVSRSWRGIGYIGGGLEMLCMVNPRVRATDEAEGWWANLVSTHPPIRNRIRILASMAHVGLSQVIEQAVPRKRSDPGGQTEPNFYALDPRHQWQGPFVLSELSLLPWISPLTWISDGGGAAERAWKIPRIGQAVFMQRLAQDQKQATGFLCPSCRQPLIEISYDRTQVYQCHFCGGVLVENAKIARIMARGDAVYSDRVRALSRTVMKENLVKRNNPPGENLPIETGTLRTCPSCKNPMMRTFYSLAYLVEIDRCTCCGVTWFDPDELEMLQCMIVNKMAADPLEPSPVG
jgi:heat shock protein HtpX